MEEMIFLNKNKDVICCHIGWSGSIHVCICASTLGSLCLPFCIQHHIVSIQLLKPKLVASEIDDNYLFFDIAICRQTQAPYYNQYHVHAQLLAFDAKVHSYAIMYHIMPSTPFDMHVNSTSILLSSSLDPRYPGIKGGAMRWESWLRYPMTSFVYPR